MSQRIRHPRGTPPLTRTRSISRFACIAALLAASYPARAASDWDGLRLIHPTQVAPSETVRLKGYEWRWIDTKHFRLYYLPQVQAEHVRQVAERVDNIWTFLKGRAGVECDSRVFVFMPATRQQYNALCRPLESRRRSAQYPAAQDFAGKSFIASETHDAVDRLASIMYETTHLFRHTRAEQMGQDNGPWCWWSGEFMARYFSMGLMRAFAVLRPRQELYAMWLRDNVVPRWGDLERMNPRQVRRRRRGFNTRVVESALHFLEQRYGQEAMIRFWQTSLDAKTARYPGMSAIFEQVFGKPMDTLEREWMAYYALGLPMDYLSRVQAAYRRNDLPRARVLAQAVLDSTPPHALRYEVWKRAWAWAAAAQCAAGLLEQAEADFETTAMFPYRWSLGPALDPFGTRYRAQWQPTNTRGALALPDDELALKTLAEILYRRGDAPQATRAYEKLAQGFPNSAQAPSYLFTWGQLLLRQQLTDAAMQAWHRAMQYPNSYHAARAGVYLGQQLVRAKKPDEARRCFEAALNVVITGPYARYTSSLHKWARRELAKLGGAQPVAPKAAPLPDSPARVVTQLGEFRRPAAEGLCTIVSASPEQTRQIETLFEKFRSLQLATWAMLGDAGADGRVWAAVQAGLLAQRRREIAALLDEDQQARMELWFLDRLPPATGPQPMPLDEDAYAAARDELDAWAFKWRQAQFAKFAADASLDENAQSKLAALVEQYRRRTRDLWAGALKNIPFEKLSERQQTLEAQLESGAAKLLAPAQRVLFKRWRLAQRDQREQYSGVTRHAPPPTQDDL